MAGAARGSGHGVRAPHGLIALPRCESRQPRCSSSPIIPAATSKVRPATPRSRSLAAGRLDGSVYRQLGQELRRPGATKSSIAYRRSCRSHGARSTTAHLPRRSRPVAPPFQRRPPLLSLAGRRVDVHLTDQDDRVLIDTGPERDGTTVTATEPLRPRSIQRTFTAGASTREGYERGPYLSARRRRSHRAYRARSAESIHVRDHRRPRHRRTVDSKVPASRRCGPIRARCQDRAADTAGHLERPGASRLMPPGSSCGTSGTLHALAADRLYAPDLGVVLGASLTHTSYGFRSVPAAKVQTLRRRPVPSAIRAGSSSTTASSAGPD